MVVRIGGTSSVVSIFPSEESHSILLSMQEECAGMGASQAFAKIFTESQDETLKDLFERVKCNPQGLVKSFNMILENCLIISEKIEAVATDEIHRLRSIFKIFQRQIVFNIQNSPFIVFEAWRIQSIVQKELQEHLKVFEVQEGSTLALDLMSEERQQVYRQAWVAACTLLEHHTNDIQATSIYRSPKFLQPIQKTVEEFYDKARPFLPDPSQRSAWDKTIPDFSRWEDADVLNDDGEAAYRDDIFYFLTKTQIEISRVAVLIGLMQEKTENMLFSLRDEDGCSVHLFEKIAKLENDLKIFSEGLTEEQKAAYPEVIFLCEEMRRKIIGLKEMNFEEDLQVGQLAVLQEDLLDDFTTLENHRGPLTAEMQFVQKRAYLFRKKYLKNYRVFEGMRAHPRLSALESCIVQRHPLVLAQSAFFLANRLHSYLEQRKRFLVATTWGEYSEALADLSYMFYETLRPDHEDYARVKSLWESLLTLHDRLVILDGGKPTVGLDGSPLLTEVEGWMSYESGE